MDGAQSDTSIRQLIQSVQADAQRLLKAQAELSQTEIKQTQQQAAATGGMFAGAAVTGGLGLVFLLVTIAYVLVELGLPTWAGFGIVTLVLLLVAGILGVVGRSKAKGIKGLELTKTEWERTKQILSGPKSEALPVPRTTSELTQRSGDVTPTQR